jgi:hypothetical protein
MLLLDMLRARLVIAQRQRNLARRRFLADPTRERREELTHAHTFVENVAQAVETMRR